MIPSQRESTIQQELWGVCQSGAHIFLRLFVGANTTTLRDRVVNRYLTPLA